jgi:hypothetical protein
MQQTFFSKNTKIFRVFFLLSITLILISACSKNETTYTGRLSIEFTNWEPEWTDHLFIIISPIEHEDKIIKQIKVNSHSVNNIELNPGNYIILIKADNNDFTPHIIKHVQIQVGETEVIKI